MVTSADTNRHGKKKPALYIATYGCQMNVRDSEHVIGKFLNHRYKLVDSSESADVILLNTCSVREHAEHKVWSALGRLKQLKKRKPQKIIGVIGCMAENYKYQIIERMPIVDLVCGPNDLSQVYDLVASIKRKQKNIIAVGSFKRKSSFYKYLYQSSNEHSYVVITEGCNNFCSYCIVPYVRGQERSRPLNEVIAEVKQLVKKGISSVTLLGQNVNSYDGGCSFPELLRKVSAIKGIKKISFATSHPKDASKELFKAMRDCVNIQRQLHLPMQSGSNKILKAMNRGYTRTQYLELAKQYKEIVGDKARLGTDIIVGFPKETEKDFNDTLDMVKKVRFDFAFMFKYSARSRTKAAELPDNVTFAVKQKRHHRLLELQRRISNENERKRQLNNQ